jgi:hypothetical protein
MSDESTDGTRSPEDPSHDGDPLVIRSIAVTLADAVTALEARLRTGRDAVIRLTPPFAGRMRARLHVAGGEGEEVGSPAPIHVDPAALFASVPAYPTPDETAARLEEPAAANSEAHRERHADRLAAWRQQVRERRVEETTIETPQGPLDVRVLWLGQ